MIWLHVLLTLIAATPDAARFVESSGELGLRFEHRHFGTGEKYMPENMGSGVTVFDANGDGRLDVYVVQGAPIGPKTPAGDDGNRLFLQRDDGTFTDVSKTSGANDHGYGMGASFGDVDRDGDLDLYVTNFGSNVLLRNRGDGSFENATKNAAVGSELWGISSGFFDADADGDLDLFVVNYVDFSWQKHKWCGNAQLKLRAYCHPDVYDGQRDVFYQNDGRGVFVKRSREAGLLATTNDKGLGLGFADFDGDGNQDVYVANDSTMNYLYLGDGKGKFVEGALLAGVAVNGAGAAEASMGVEIGDLDGDGRFDLFLTHLDQETNTLYKNFGDGMFVDGTQAAGLARPGLPWVGFGNVFFDHDNDGDLDVFVANGHIIDNIERFDPTRAHRQPAQLFDNQGDGTFVEITAALGLDEPLVGRGAVAADLDRDGDEDLVVTQNGGRLLVLRNVVGTRHRSLGVRLVGKESNPQGFGAMIEVSIGDRRLVRLMKSVSGYLSQGPPEILFGLGTAESVDALVVRWPSGRVDRHEKLTAGFFYTLEEGAAVVKAKQAFSG